MKMAGLFLAILLCIGNSYAQTIFTWTGATNNNWNVTTNWTKVGPSTSTWPNQNAGQNDQAIINSGGTPIVNATFGNNSLTVVTINGTGTLTISGGFTLLISGNLDGTGTFSQSAGTLNITGDVTISTLALTGGTFAYTGTGSQIVKADTYNNLTKSGAGGTATLAGNITVIGATSVASGTLDLGASNLNSATLTGAGTINFGGGTISLTGNNTSTITHTGSPVNYSYTGGVGQTLRGTAYDNLTLSGAGTKTASAATTVNGTLTTSSLLAMGANALVLLGPVANSGGSQTSTGSVTYNSASNQDVIPGTAATLTKNGTGTATFTGNLVCTAGITLTAGTLDISNFSMNGTTLTGAGTLAAGSGTITLTGNNSHTGTFNAGTSNFNYAVNGAQNIAGYNTTGYYNLTISNNNVKTLLGPLKVNNVFLYNGTGTFAIGNNNADFNHFNQTAGTITLGTGSLSFSGNVHKTAGTYTPGSGALSFSGTGFVRSNGALTLSSGATTIDGTRTIQGAGVITLSSVTVNGTLSNKINLIVNSSLSGSGIYSNDSTASLLDVNFTGAGPTVSTFSVNSTGGVRYGAAGAQTTRNAAYYNLLTAGSGTKSISSGTSVINDLTLGAATDCASNLNIGGAVSGASSLTITGNSILTVSGNYGGTGGLTITGTGTFNANSNVTHGAGALAFNASSVIVSGNISGTGTIGFTSGGLLTVSGNYGTTGTMTMAGTCTFNANGNVNHGGGGLVLNTSTANIAGTLQGTGTVSFSGTGAINFTGPGGWASTSGTFTPSTSTVTYSGTTGSQTVRSTTYFNLTLTGAATKNYGVGASGTVSGVFNNTAGQTLVFPAAASTLSLTGSVTGTGKILGDPTGTLTVGSPGAVSSSLGTLYFDTTKVIGTINFNRQWNRAYQVRMGSSVRLNYYTFAGGFTVGGVEVADGEIFKVESPIVTPTSTLAANVGRLRYILLGTGAKFVFQPSGTIPAGTNLTFPIGPLPTAGTPWQVLEGNAQGTLNAATIGATVVNGAGVNFNDQVLVGYNLILSDGTIVGEIEAINTNTQLFIKAPGCLVNVPAGSTFRLSQVYRPVTIIPSVAVTGGSLEVSMLNHSGGLLTNGTNVPNIPINRRTNFIYRIRGTGGFPTSAVWTEALLSNDFNATINLVKYSFFRWNGSFWTKLAADFVGTGAVPTNTQIQRNTITTMAGVQTYILGQTGGILPDDPTFSWTGAGGNNLWKNSGNWNVFPSGSGPWPDDIGHNVVIDGSGIGSPVILTGDSINVRHIFHSAKKLTIQNNGVLTVIGNYSFNQPTLTAAGVGRLIQNGFNITGTNGSQFTTQLTPGTLLYSTEGGFIGAVRSITNDAALVLQAIGGGTVTNLPDSTTFNIIVPTSALETGTITASTASNVVTGIGTNFTAAWNGRALYNNATNALLGTIAIVQSPTSLLLVNNSYANGTNIAFKLSSPVSPFGTATTDFQNGSRVNYNNALADQTIAATSYSWINFIDNRVGASTDLVRFVNCPGQTITVRNRFRGRVHVKAAASLGPIWQFQNNSRMSIIFPSGSSTTAGSWNNFSTNGVAGAYNVKWGTLPTHRIHFDGFSQGTGSFTLPAMEREIGSRFGDFTLINTVASGRYIMPAGSSFVVNGAFTLTNTAGPASNVLAFGNNTINPPASLTLLGAISGLNNLANAGAPVHLGNITIGGTGSISGDLFEDISQLRNLTINRVGANLSLSGVQNLTVDEKIVVAKGTFGHTGTGTIAVGSASPSGVEVTGGTLSMSSGSNLNVVSSGNFLLSSGVVNLNNTGSVTISGNYTQTTGTFNRPTNPISIGGNIGISGGTFSVAGSTFTLNGANPQSLSFPAAGITMTNLTINKPGSSVSATIAAGKLRIIGTVNMPVTNTANLATTPGGNLTLVSNASGTARIGSVLGGALAGNNYTFERYVNGGVQGWYFLGTPVDGQSLTDWSDDFGITTPVVCSGTLTDIIDRNTVYLLKGDAVPANGPTSFEANGWRAPTSCAINVAEGYRVFLKAAFFSTPRVYDNTGALTSGTKSLPVTFNPSGYDGGGWNLVSNPYPSNIDWDVIGGWTKTNLQNALYIWKGAANQYGSYINGISTNGVDNIIPSGQAFMVRANASPVLTINENAKTAVAKNLFRSAMSRPVIRLTLKKGEQADESAIHFSEGATEGFDSNFDAAKMLNPYLSLYSILENQKYAINGLELNKEMTVIPLGLASNQTGTLELVVSGINSMAPEIEVYLKDNYLNQLNQLIGDQTISFEANANPSSLGENRFELIFKNSKLVNTSTSKGLKGEITLYPNPAQSGYVNLNFESKENQGVVTIHDLVGKVVYRKSISEKSNSHILPVPEKSGIYTVSFNGLNGQRWTTKLVVE